jgi:hypothetical protein
MKTGVSITLSEPFPTLVLAIAIMVVIIDLSVVGDRRERMAAKHRTWWDRLHLATYSRLISDAATGFYAIHAIKFVEGRSRIFHIVIAFVAVGMIAAAFLVAGALLFEPDLEAVISHELNCLTSAPMGQNSTIA